jgi:transcriptional regulator with XRE-family HTH domain
MNFIPERLISVREALGINKAEAARMLNLSAMGYGRYEKGEREPSYQMVNYIAQTFGKFPYPLLCQTSVGIFFYSRVLCAISNIVVLFLISKRLIVIQCI